MKKTLLVLTLLSTLAACGYKGNLYLPKPNDKARFGVVQTDIHFTAPRAASQSQPSENTP